jgi:Spy/CpxP family protein refolding chaperone
MKLSLLAVAALWAGVALAQAPEAPTGGLSPSREPGPGGRHESPAERMDHLATLLDLTAGQKTQVQAVLEEEHARMKAQREQSQASGTRPTFEQMKAAHEQAQKDTLAKLTPILNPDQLKKFQVLMDHRGTPGGPH